MSPLKINTLLVMCGVLVMLGCIAKQEPAAPNVPEPVIDFKALADLQESGADFSQVLLRVELLNTHTDILKYGISSPEAHQARLSYYRTDFKNDVFLVAGIDTIPCYDVHAERMYMDLPYMNFILTFNHSLSNNDELLIHDVVYSNKTIFVTIDPQIPLQ